MKDPIIEEVRAARRQITEECDNDMHKLFLRQKRVFAEWKGKKITEPFHPEWKPPKPACADVAEDEGVYGTP